MRCAASLPGLTPAIHHPQMAYWVCILASSVPAFGRPGWMKRVDPSQEPHGEEPRSCAASRTMGRAAILRDARQSARSSRDNGEAVVRG
jgi:hypothetical protein